MTANMIDGKMPWHLSPPDIGELRDAAARMAPILIETPLLESDRLNARLGGRLLVKAESLQRTGSFKARGAWNWFSLLPSGAAGQGFVALSSGNHGQAVAWVAGRFGLGPVVILMPEDTPRAKVERTRAWGADIEFYDRSTVDRAALLHHWTEVRGHIMVPAYDDRRIIAGAGTIGLESLRQAAARGTRPDRMVVAFSGGGLSAGCAIGLTGSGTTLLAVEPVGYDDMARSLAAGMRIANSAAPPNICDALLAPTPGALTFDINQRAGTTVVTVSERHAREAVAVLAKEFGLIVEPGGALPLGALLANPGLAADRTTVVVASGANIDTSLLSDILAGG
jgi:threonine dehydratase